MHKVLPKPERENLEVRNLSRIIGEGLIALREQRKAKTTQIE